MILMYSNHEIRSYNLYENLKDTIHAIYYLTEHKNYSKFFIIYQSSFRSQNGRYCICFTSIGCDDEYIIVSEEFISLKEVSHLVKTAKMFFKEGGVITNYE